MNYDPEIHHRRSIRLKDYDYSQNGFYFITICIEGKRCLLGRVNDDEVILSSVGEGVLKEWRDLPQRFVHVELGEFVIMPNHIHGILHFSGQKEQGRSSLGEVVGAFKSLCFRHYKDDGGIGHLWQRNYYEHIIRCPQSHGEITWYIHTNPMRWREDDLYMP